MQIKFTKMHGLGNDFMVIDAISQKIALTQQQIHQLADRHFGVGFDQLLLVEPAESKSVDFRYRIFNSDGGEVEQCGNGARCFARFVVEKGLTDKRDVVVETQSGIITLNNQEDGQVTVDIGVPQFAPEDIPFIGQLADRYKLELELKTGAEVVEVGVVSMGNPHAVMLVPDIDSAPVETFGPLIEHHRLFPKRVNAGFMEIVDRNNIKLRVYERGVGETMACGTGACAAVVVAQKWGLLNDQVDVMLLGGELRIKWPGEGRTVHMTGPAETVFEGVISI